MGLYDRDYGRFRPVRGTERQGSFGWFDGEVWKKIIIANVIVFIAQFMFVRAPTEEDLLEIPWLRDQVAEIDAIDDQEAASRYRQMVDAQRRFAGDPEYGPSSSALASEEIPEELSEDDTLIYAEKYREYMRAQLLAMAPKVSLIEDLFALSSDKVARGQVWRLFTCGFCHDRMGIYHILFNMLFLYWFGSRLERKYGSPEFTAFYVISLLVSSLAYVALDLYTNANMSAIGASGAVFGVVVLYALLYPYERIYIYFLFPVEIRWMVALYVIYDLHPVLIMLGGDEYHDGVAHAAHLGGALFGFAYWYNRWELMPTIRQAKASLGAFVPQQGGSGGGPRVLKTPFAEREKQTTPEDQRRLDEILAKISREGRESLSNEELRVLEETSRKIRVDREDEGA